MATNFGFWKKLKKPFFVLAPMAEVTDAAFRRVIAGCGKPDVIYTGFVSADGLCSAGRKKLQTELLYSERERPIVAQIFGANPETVYRAAQFIKSLGFDGLDINMGCPDRAVEKQGAGVALIKNPKLAQEIILAAKKGADPLPVSVKTRIGYLKDTLDEWLSVLLETELAAIVIHARTRKEMSRVPAHWEAVARAVTLAQKFKAKTLIIGNGDVKTLTEARQRTLRTGAAGVMIGRAVLGNPWLFNPHLELHLSPKLRLETLYQHTVLFEKLFKKEKNFALMRKHFIAYTAGFRAAKKLRAKLMRVKTSNELKKVIGDYLETLSGA